MSTTALLLTLGFAVLAAVGVPFAIAIGAVVMLVLVVNAPPLRFAMTKLLPSPIAVKSASAAFALIAEASPLAMASLPSPTWAMWLIVVPSRGTLRSERTSTFLPARSPSESIVLSIISSCRDMNTAAHDERARPYPFGPC